MNGQVPWVGFERISLGLIVAGLATVGVAVLVLGRAMRSLHRRLELTIVAGSIGHLLLQSLALARDDATLIDWAVVVSMSSLLIAANRGDSAQLGQPVSEHQTVVQARLWSPLVAIGGVLGVALVFRLGVRLEVAAACVVGSLAFAGFAAREMFGPHKPPVLPFGRRDRALQRLANDLVEGDIRLIGRPVVRAADGVTVGIESEPDWCDATWDAFPIQGLAGEARLTELLDQQTLQAARTHLPGLLNALGGDEPWLSVPVTGRVPHTFGKRTDDNDLDGLVLRLHRAPTLNEADQLDQWRDLGVWLQLNDASAQAFEASGDWLSPEIVSMAIGERSDFGKSAMMLVRVDQPGVPVADIHRGGAYFTVNQAQSPSQFSRLLSPASPAASTSDESVRPLPPSGTGDS